MITMKWKGLQKVRNRYARLETRLSDPTEPLTQSRGILSRSIDKTFNMEGRPGKWPERVSGGEWPILDKTGHLRDSTADEQDGNGSVSRLTIKKFAGWLTFGTDVEYGWYHQVTGVGKSKIKRAFLAIHAEDKTAIQDVFLRWLKRLTK